MAVCGVAVCGVAVCGVAVCGVAVCGVAVCGVAVCGVAVCGVAVCGVAVCGVAVCREADIWLPRQSAAPSLIRLVASSCDSPVTALWILSPAQPYALPDKPLAAAPIRAAATPMPPDNLGLFLTKLPTPLTTPPRKACLTISGGTPLPMALSAKP